MEPSSRDDFHVAIICALTAEYDAVTLIFDQFWDEDGDRFSRATGDINQYTIGRIGKYNVVLALLPYMGKVDAAGSAASMRSSYRNLKLALLVGICSGVPIVKGGEEILLGDVVISKTVVQFDLGRQQTDGFVRKDTVEDNLGRPAADVRNLIGILSTDLGLELIETRTVGVLRELQSKAGQKKRAIRDRYTYLGTSQDKLFEASYRHKHRTAEPCICSSCVNDADPICEQALYLSCVDLACGANHLIPRDRLIKKQHMERDGNPAAQNPSLWVGTVASGNMVIKSARDRDRIARQTGAIAFQMEGVGIWDGVPSLVIKGVCDYADCHKNKDWQYFASATAASVAKAILERYYVQTDQTGPAEGQAVQDSAAQASPQGAQSAQGAEGWRKTEHDRHRQGIEVIRQSVDATPQDHPDYATRLNNLGNRLNDRYKRTGVMEDLEEAIQIGRQAVNATPQDYPDRPGRLNNLGVLRSNREAVGSLPEMLEVPYTFMDESNISTNSDESNSEPTAVFTETSDKLKSGVPGTSITSSPFSQFGQKDAVPQPLPPIPSTSFAPTDSRLIYRSRSIASFQTSESSIMSYTAIFSDWLSGILRRSIQPDSSSDPTVLSEILPEALHENSVVMKALEELQRECMPDIPSQPMTPAASVKSLPFLADSGAPRDQSESMTVEEKMEMFMESHPLIGSDTASEKRERYHEILKEQKEEARLIAKLRGYHDLRGIDPSNKKKVRQTVIAALRTQPYARGDRTDRRESSSGRIGPNTGPPMSTALFYVEWDPAAFVEQVRLPAGENDEVWLSEQDDSGTNETSTLPILARLITVTGDQNRFQALPCREYMIQTWPLVVSNTPLDSMAMAPLLSLLCRLVDSPDHGSEDTESLGGESFIKASLGINLRVVVHGTDYEIAEIAEQLGWLGSALRAPDQDGKFSICSPICHPEMATTSQPDGYYFSMRFETRELPVDTNHRTICWMSLFKKLTIAGGYPIPSRPEEFNGLQVSLHQVAKIVHARRLDRFRSRNIVKGFSTALYPTKASRLKDFIAWHLIVNDNGSRLSYADTRIGKGEEQSSVRLLHREDIMKASHIIGWCAEVKNVAGTRHAAYDNILGSGKLQVVDFVATLDKIEFSGGTTNFKAATTFTLDTRVWGASLPFKPGTANNWIKSLESVGQGGKCVIFYDVPERRAWLVNTYSAMLHVLRASLQHDREGRFHHLYRGFSRAVEDKLNRLERDIEQGRDYHEPFPATAAPNPSEERAGQERNDLDWGEERVPLGAAGAVPREGGVELRDEELEPKEDDVQPVSVPQRILTNRKFCNLPLRQQGYGLSSGADETEAKTCVGHRIEDLVEAFQKIQDMIPDTAAASKPSISVPASGTAVLEGYDFWDLATLRGATVLSPKSVRLHRVAEGWFEFTREIRAITLFGSGFGDILRPVVAENPGCRRCLWNMPMPTGKDIMALTVTDLIDLHRPAWAKIAANERTVRGTFSWGDSGRCFDPCDTHSRGTNAACSSLMRVQPFRPRRNDPPTKYKDSVPSKSWVRRQWKKLKTRSMHVAQPAPRELQESRSGAIFLGYPDDDLCKGRAPAAILVQTPTNTTTLEMSEEEGAPSHDTRASATSPSEAPSTSTTIQPSTMDSSRTGEAEGVTAADFPAASTPLNIGGA